MILGVTGGRDFKLSEEGVRVFSEMLLQYDPSFVFHGDAKGIDTDCARVAKSYGKPVQALPADWEYYDVSAGPIRNTALVKCIQILIAFPGGKGTNDCFNKAKSRMLVVIDLRDRMDLVEKITP